ncbi:hypothetical protein BGZ50_009397, partial [Haplosporangium sp. Z 11]
LYVGDINYTVLAPTRDEKQLGIQDALWTGLLAVEWLTMVSFMDQTSGTDFTMVMNISLARMICGSN